MEKWHVANVKSDEFYFVMLINEDLIMNENENGYLGDVEVTNYSFTETTSSTNAETQDASSLVSETSTSFNTNETTDTENHESGFNSNFSETQSVTSQELAEIAHNETKQNMIAEHGRYMSEEQIATLESEETKDRLTVMTSEEYTETFPDVDFNVLGHCDSEGNIYMKDISPEIIKHVSTHETMHLCAHRENYMNEYGNKTIISGLRESLFNEDGSVTDLNRGANEGLTEMYTLRELQNRGEAESAYALNAYSESRMWSERIEKLIGSEKMAEAYFGGKRENFKKEFNRLNDNDPHAWENYSRDIDILEYSNDPNKIEQAKWRLMSQYSTMAHNKYSV